MADEVQLERFLAAARFSEGENMKCFQHRTLDAIGICKSCGKALCADCVADLTNGIACRNSCESRVKLLNEMVDSNVRRHAMEKSLLRSLTLFALFMGLLILGFAWFEHTRGSPFLAVFFGAFGMLFTAFGVLRLFAGRYPRLPSESKPSDTAKMTFGISDDPCSDRNDRVK